MILKGSTRAGANDLALHLSNAVDNERVSIKELRGMVADNLYDGFREWELISDQTNAKEPFYSLSINPDPNQRDWNAEEWMRAIEHIEEKLGLTGQPRAIIFHEKEGEDGRVRKHAHVVWSRIKLENGKLKAISMSHDYYKLKACAKDLAKEFGLDLPNGLSAGIKTDSSTRKEKKCDHYDHAKSHGMGRDPDSVQERKALITKIWNESQGADQFCNHMRAAGYIVARGNRRSFVIVDREKRIHGFARQIAGVNTKAIKERLGNAHAYPDIEQAVDEYRIREQSAPGLANETSTMRVDLSKEQRLMQKLRRMAIRADKMGLMRRAKLVKLRRQLELRQSEERETLLRRQRAKEAQVLVRRQKEKPEGLSKNLRVIFGIEMFRKWKHILQDNKRKKAFLQEKMDLQKNQKTEIERLQRKSKIIRKQQIRESQTINRYSRRLGLGALQKRLHLKEHFKTHSTSAVLSYS
ncbi:MAG: hypothetical protein AAGC95_16265 [Pseudomonadota bacterium]